MEIEINKEIVISTSTEVTKLISKVTKIVFTDDGEKVIADIYADNNIFPFKTRMIIWNAGDEYNEAGQYDDEAIQNRVIELLNQMSK